MDDSRFKFIDKAIAAFSFGTIQDLLTLLIIIEREGISLDELNKFKELKIVTMAKNNNFVTKTCPDCNAYMVLERLNINSRTMTGDDSKIVYTCINPKCMNQIFE